MWVGLKNGFFRIFFLMNVSTCFHDLHHFPYVNGQLSPVQASRPSERLLAIPQKMRHTAGLRPPCRCSDAPSGPQRHRRPPSGRTRQAQTRLRRKKLSLIGPYPLVGSMVLLYMVTWIPSIYPRWDRIYTSTMDPSWDIGP